MTKSQMVSILTALRPIAVKSDEKEYIMTRDGDVIYKLKYEVEKSAGKTVYHLRLIVLEGR